MKLRPIKTNMTELELDFGDVLFSYQTPVAFLDKNGIGYRTEKKWSNTTTKHINQWFKGYGEGKADTALRLMPQEWFDELVK